jgi:hypothetical protein
LRSTAGEIDLALAQERARTATLGSTVAELFLSIGFVKYDIVGLRLEASGSSQSLVVSNSGGSELVEDARLIAWDPVSQEYMGTFEVTEVEQEHCLARPVDRPDPIWWGMMVQSAEGRQNADTRIVVYHRSLRGG